MKQNLIITGYEVRIGDYFNLCELDKQIFLKLTFQKPLLFKI